jgi:hypothetical protein
MSGASVLPTNEEGGLAALSELVHARRLQDNGQPRPVSRRFFASSGLD